MVPETRSTATQLKGLTLSQDFDNTPPPRHFGLGTHGNSGVSVTGGNNDAPTPRAPKSGKVGKFSKMNMSDGGTTIF